MIWFWEFYAYRLSNINSYDSSIQKRLIGYNSFKWMIYLHILYLIFKSKENVQIAGNSVELIRCLCVARFWQSLFWYSKSLKRVIRVRHRKYLWSNNNCKLIWKSGPLTILVGNYLYDNFFSDCLKLVLCESVA